MVENTNQHDIGGNFLNLRFIFWRGPLSHCIRWRVPLLVLLINFRLYPKVICYVLRSHFSIRPSSHLWVDAMDPVNLDIAVLRQNLLYTLPNPWTFCQLDSERHPKRLLGRWYRFWVVNPICLPDLHSGLDYRLMDSRTYYRHPSQKLRIWIWCVDEN